MTLSVLGFVGQGSSADVGPASDAVAMLGTGTVTPGLPTSGCGVPQETTFAGTLTVVVGDDTQMGTLDFDGTSTIACPTFVADAGNGTLSGSIKGPATYTRNQEIMTIAGDVFVNGEAHDLTATCQLTPTSANPTVTYAVTCQGLLTS